MKMNTSFLIMVPLVVVFLIPNMPRKSAINRRTPSKPAAPKCRDFHSGRLMLTALQMCGPLERILLLLTRQHSENRIKTALNGIPDNF
jgi:hypothetical protein